MSRPTAPRYTVAAGVPDPAEPPRARTAGLRPIPRQGVCAGPGCRRAVPLSGPWAGWCARCAAGAVA